MPEIYGWTASNVPQLALGTIVFSNSNGFTFGMAGSATITASYSQSTAPGAVAAGTQTATSGTIVFSNSNGFTFGMSNSSIVTVSYTQSTAPGGISAGTQLATSGTIIFSNSNGVSFGMSNSSIMTASVAAGGGAGAGISAGTQSVSTGTVVFSNSNGFTFGMSNSSIVTVSYTQSTAPGAIQAGTQTATSGTIIFSNSNNVSFGMSNTSVVTASASYSQSTAPNAIAAGTQTATSGTIIFSNSNGFTFGMSNSSIVTASYTQSTAPGGISAGTQLATSGTIIFSNSNGVSFGMSNSSVITASVAGGGGGGGVAASAGTQSVSTGTVIFSNSNGVSFGMSNSSVITAAMFSISSYEPYPIHNTGTGALSAGTNTSATATFIPFTVPNYLLARHVAMIQSVSFITMGTSSGRQSNTLSYGIYTRDVGANSTRLSVLTSGSYSFGVTYQNSTITINQPTTTNSADYSTGSTTSAGLNISSGYTGRKLVQFIINSTLSPGQYWLGLLARNSSSSINGGVRYTFIGNQYTLSDLAPVGSFSSAWTTGTNLASDIGNYLVGFGVFTSANQTNLPGTVALSAMSANVSILPYMRFATTA